MPWIRSGSRRSHHSDGCWPVQSHPALGCRQGLPLTKSAFSAHFQRPARQLRATRASLVGFSLRPRTIRNKCHQRARRDRPRRLAAPQSAPSAPRDCDQTPILRSGASGLCTQKQCAAVQSRHGLRQRSLDFRINPHPACRRSNTAQQLAALHLAADPAWHRTGAPSTPLHSCGHRQALPKSGWCFRWPGSLTV